MRHGHRLDFGLLERSVSCLFGAGLAPSTLRAYQSRYSRYQQSCERTGIAAIWIPTSERTLCLLVVFLADDGIVHCTCKNALLAVHYVRIRHGLGNPLAFSLPLLVTGLTRRFAVDVKSQMAAAITNQSRCVLFRLKDYWLQEWTR